MSEQFSFLDSRQKHSLFFAFLPETRVAAASASLAGALRVEHGLKGRPRPPAALHVSLFEVQECDGDVPPSVLKAACDAAAGIVAPVFDVTFDRAVSFGGRSGSPPVVLRAEGGNHELIQFRRTLFAAMKRAGVGRNEKDQFTPHMTLLYDQQRIDERPVQPVSWTAREFVLVDSFVGQSRYEIRGRWPLHS